MDLNPQPPAEWTSAAGPYELADHCVKHKSKLLVLLNAWLDPTVADPDAAQDDNDSEGQDDAAKEDEGDGSDDEEPEWSTLNYWSARLRPLWRSNGRRRGSNETIYSDDSAETENDEYEEAVEDEEIEEEAPHETIVVACNRTGKENGTCAIHPNMMTALIAIGKTFAGSSAIFSMRMGSGRPKLLDMMGKREEGVRVWNLVV